MALEGSLDWVMVCNDPNRGKPVRALVHKTSRLYRKQSGLELEDLRREERDADGAPTLLLATGRGKVRAGIFSRNQLMTGGIESATALPMVRDARARGMRCIIPDPNARGERYGMETFGRTISAIVDSEDQAESSETQKQRPQQQQDERESSNMPLYVLAHSASGAQFVRHLREAANKHILPRVRAVAFTDSTHNVQWAKKDAPELARMLESSRSLYVRSSDVRRDADAKVRSPGEKAETDHFWEHRFGKIRTIWAGTAEHSLTNWTAHDHIWEHFDQFR